MLLGYQLDPEDNNEFFIADESKLPKKYRYSNIYDYNEIPADLRLKSRQLDISSTWDLVDIVSDRFKVFCEENQFTGLEFIRLPADNSFYVFRVHNIIEYDSVSRGVEFIKFNKEYNSYEEVIGATPVHLKSKELIPEGNIYRTDLFFGSGIRKGPLLLVGIKTKELIESGPLKDIYFDEVLTEYPPVIKTQKKWNWFKGS
jgi:hypothetical protein